MENNELKTLTSEELEEIVELTNLLSDDELKAIGISEDDLKNPTEETLTKIQKYFKNLATQN